MDANFICIVLPFNQKKFMKQNLWATTKLTGNLSSFSVKWSMNRFSSTHSQQKIEWILQIWNMQRQQIIFSSIFLFSKSGWYIFFCIKKENRVRLKLHRWGLGWILDIKCKRTNKSFGRKMTALSFSSSELTSEISLRNVLVERFVSLWRKKKDERLKPRVHIWSFYVI